MLQQCPIGYVSEDIWDVIGFAGLYAKGLPPIAGGVLDQAAMFINTVKFIWQEESQYKYGNA